MSLAQFVILGLAVWQAVEIWHHSAIFAEKRSLLEARGDWLADLTRCPFCLSVWVGMVFAFILNLEFTITWVPDASVSLAGVAEVLFWFLQSGLKLFVYGLAGSRLANLGNDLSYQYCRTFRHNRLNLPEPPAEGDTPLAT